MKIDSEKIRILLGNESQRSFSKRIGMSESWLSTALRIGEMTAPTLTKIAKGLNVDAKDLLEERR